MAGDGSSMPMVLEVEDTRQAGALLKELWNWWTREIGKSLITFRPNYEHTSVNMRYCIRHFPSLQRKTRYCVPHLTLANPTEGPYAILANARCLVEIEIKHQ